MCILQIKYNRISQEKRIVVTFLRKLFFWFSFSASKPKVPIKDVRGFLKS